MKKQNKALFIKTWGCQMNVYDSNRMADILSSLGYSTVDSPENADMIILNTCHIREKATDKVFSELGRLKKFKDQKKLNNEKMVLAVAGCVAQAEGDFILERAPYVDLVFGPQTYHELPEMMIEVTGQRVINTDFPAESKFDYLPENTNVNTASAFLSIQEGCDKFCTFCVVPYTRGAEYSRNIDEIYNEAKQLVDRGVKEITLLGQNVNAFHGKDDTDKTWNLAQLIHKISDINGLERIRYSTSHPKDMDEDLIQAHASIEKLMPFLHLPVQSGSDKILKAMNRKHDAERYLSIINDLRKARPDIAMSSDFIVGFPGESDTDFQDTLNLVSKVNFASAYSFKYSARPGTPAANMTNLVPEHIKTERIQALQSLLNEQQLTFNKNTIGMTVPVLLDKKGSKNNQLHGRTPYNQAVHVKANERLIGQILDVELILAHANSLTGQIKTDESITVTSQVV